MWNCLTEVLFEGIILLTWSFGWFHLAVLNITSILSSLTKPKIRGWPPLREVDIQSNANWDLMSIDVQSYWSTFGRGHFPCLCLNRFRKWNPSDFYLNKQIHFTYNGLHAQSFIAFKIFPMPLQHAVNFRERTMDVVQSWADQLAKLFNTYNGVKSDAFFAVVSSGSRLSNYISIVSFQESSSAKQPLRGKLRWPMFSHWLQPLEMP